MSTAEAASATKPVGLLDQIEVLKPEHAAEKTKKYLCGIRKPTDPNEHAFELHLRVGAATFCTETFQWKGSGENAQQIFRDGAIQDLTDAQVKDIQAKLKHRYVRKVYAKDAKGNPFLTGILDIDASDSGVVEPPTPAAPEGYRRDPARVPGRLRGDENPLKDLLIFEQVYDNPRLNGRTLTVADLKAMLAEAEAEESRLVEGDDAVFESGKGGKKARAAADRDPKTLEGLATTDGKRKAEGGYLGGK